MTPADMDALAARLAAATTGGRRLHFGIWPTGGWVISGSREVVEVLCALWNAREVVATALREHAERIRAAQGDRS